MNLFTQLLEVSQKMRARCALRRIDEYFCDESRWVKAQFYVVEGSPKYQLRPVPSYPDACCLVGALQFVGGNYDAQILLEKACGRFIPLFNDDPKTTFVDLKSVIAEARKLAA